VARPRAASRSGPDTPPPGTVRVDDVWESFKIYHERPQGIRDRLFARRKTVAEDFLALKGVSVHLEPGDTVGLIGENGSGKSTLLKCIAGILRPTKGELQTYGRVASMLEVGAGFHGDLTGRENVFLNGSILGFSRKFVAEVFDEIVEFAGPRVTEAIDNPVRTYSSGMYLRLGFAVSVHLQPDILIVDEVLAVGDAAFQKQCFDRIHELKRRGVTICVVSHDLDTVSSLCDRGVYLRSGEVMMDGAAIDVVDRYREDVTVQQGGGGEVSKWTGGQVYGSGEATIRDIHFVSPPDRDTVTTGDKVAVELEMEAKASFENPVFGLIVRANDGTYLYDTNTMWRHQVTGTYEAGDVANVRFDLLVNLLPGRYVVTVAVSRHDGKQVFDWHTDAVGFDVVGEFIANGVVELDAAITVEQRHQGQRGA
jgi:ABC-2 type transport system ATP-binding protein